MAKSKLKRAPAKRRPRKAKAGTRGLTPLECRLDELTGKAAEARARVEESGGVVLGSYNDPLGNSPLLLAILPIHRLEAMRRLGARAITALIVPKREIAWQILALNTEKAHNLREKALEVIRIYRGLIEEDAARPEEQFSFYLEEASLATLGVCYERNGKFAGGAYNPIVRRLQGFSKEALSASIRQHEKSAGLLMELDERVTAVVARLKEKGFVSPYLRAFVVARINPLRWVEGEPPPLEEVLETMRSRAAKFNVDKVKQSDLAGAGGAPDRDD